MLDPFTPLLIQSIPSMAALIWPVYGQQSPVVLTIMPVRSGCSKILTPTLAVMTPAKGMTAIVSIKHPDPQFESQTKVKLMNPEVQTYVQQVVGDTFSTFLEREPSSSCQSNHSKMSDLRTRTRLCSQESARSLMHPQIRTQINDLTRQVSRLL